MGALKVKATMNCNVHIRLGRVAFLISLPTLSSVLSPSNKEISFYKRTINSQTFCHVFLVFREGFLSSGDVASYQSVSDNMVTALPLLSDSIQPGVFGLSLPVPPPLETRSGQVGVAA